MCLTVPPASCFSWASREHATQVVDFFMERVERASEKEWDFRPCNYGHYVHVPLQFRESAELPAILRKVCHWMRSRSGDYLFDNRAADLFDAMFSPFNENVIAVLQAWIDTAGAEDIHVISRILNKVHPNFVFEQRVFVTHVLERARQFGKKSNDEALTALFGSAITGLRAGTLGQPCPQDLEARERAEKALKETPRFSAAYKLYEYIKRDAEQNIKQSLRMAETLEE
jgi:hypothetical protein